MVRQVIKIDGERCDGCGLCVDVCHESAIILKSGKAVLSRDEYCDGLGDCLLECPAGAISFEQREALPYDEEAVQENIRRKKEPLPCGCPGTQARRLVEKAPADGIFIPCAGESELRQWPVQIALVPVNASYFSGADLLIAADCAAYAYGNFHADFMRGKVTLIGCPKPDAADCAAKLAAIFENNAIGSVTSARMSVPCCAGLEQAVISALKKSGRHIPLRSVTITPEGGIVQKRE